ncbi:NUDIX hydrolase [Candidatus Micrarchaeota archaeon]|nr:NUDIX hydrolase [Candidatus Micrarchaeota archaeon]
MRETKEEIGCDVKLIKYLGYKDFRIEGKDFRSHMFLAKLESGQMPKIKEPERFRDMFWLPIKNYREYSVAPNVRQFCEDYIKRGLDVLHDV